MATRRKKPASKLAKSKKELALKKGRKAGLKSVKKRPARKIERAHKSKKATKKEHKETKSELSQEEIIIMAAKVEREKKFIMWSGVTFFMILIAFFWLYNTKQVLENSKIEREDTPSLFTDWESVSEELGSAITEIKESVKTESDSEDILNEAEIKTDSLPSVDEAKSTTSNEAVLPSNTENNPTEIDALKARLEELEEKLKNNQ